MKIFVAVLVAAMAAASPACACGFFSCIDRALADDAYPPGQLRVSPWVRYEVEEGLGRGLSLSGLYNDPALALRLADRRAAPWGDPAR